MFVLGWLASYIKSGSLVLNIFLIATNYIAVISVSILNAVFIIFFFSAGYLLNLDLALSICMIGLYIYLAKVFIKMWDDIFSLSRIKNLIIKKLPTVFIIAPFIISFGIFYYLYYGDKIYKLSPHCQNTNDPIIKFCKYSNGTYTGEMKAFRRHGLGKYVWNSGKVYDGLWDKGKELN
tara:strand:- start:694 stop:1227 length:534 start_codon:yes stop_codon:yes gene_type:complete